MVVTPRRTHEDGPAAGGGKHWLVNLIEVIAVLVTVLVENNTMRLKTTVAIGLVGT